MKSVHSYLTHNPTCNSGFERRACVWTSKYGLTFSWSGKGYIYLTGQTGCEKGCGAETISIQGPDVRVLIIKPIKWELSSTHSVFIPLKKPDDYRGFATINDPGGGTGTAVNFNLIVPQVGNSNMVITTTSLPAGKLKTRYHFRLSVRGGTSPYSWTLVTKLPKGLGFITTGPNAGTIHGIPRQSGWYMLPVIVHDEAGHAAYAYFDQLLITP
jgi:hypothetical protein